MKKIRIALLASSLFFVACGGKEEKKKEEVKNEYEKTKENLQEKEKSNPVLFLSVTGTDKHNLIGQMVVKGKITNKAIATSYKDVEVKLAFYSKTGTLLENDKETVYETVEPGKTVSFKTKYFAPKGSDSVALEVLSAKVAE